MQCGDKEIFLKEFFFISLRVFLLLYDRVSFFHFWIGIYVGVKTVSSICKFPHIIKVGQTDFGGGICIRFSKLKFYFYLVIIVFIIRYSRIAVLVNIFLHDISQLDEFEVEGYLNYLCYVTCIKLQ